MNSLSMPLLAALLATQSASTAQPSSMQMNDLAAEKGCYLCHQAEPGKPGASAPSWKEIARKYHGEKDAQDRLTEIVLSGSGRGGKERHWQGKVRDGGMLPNVKELDEDQATQLVRWILSIAP